MICCKDNEVANTLNEITQKGSAWAVANGFLWLKNVFLPCLENAQNNQNNIKELLADGCYVLGDLYDFINAPKAAIKAYKQSIKYSGNSSGAYREIALCYEAMGDYENALKYNGIAQKKEPADSFAATDRKWMEKAMEDQSEPLFKIASKVWQCDELLAEMRFVEALKCLGDAEDIKHCSARARCYGALSNNEAYLNEWVRIVKQKEPFKLDYSDWFYMPEEVFESPEIWRLFFAVQDKIGLGVFVGFFSFEDSELSGELKQEEIQQVMILYNLYRTEKNIDSLRKLANQYPRLPEIRYEIENLSA